MMHLDEIDHVSNEILKFLKCKVLVFLKNFSISLIISLILVKYSFSRVFDEGAGDSFNEILTGLFLRKEGSIPSITEEINSEPSPQVFQPPSITIKLPVFFIDLIIIETSRGLIILKSISSILLSGKEEEISSIASFWLIL